MQQPKRGVQSHAELSLPHTLSIREQCRVRRARRAGLHSIQLRAGAERAQVLRRSYARAAGQPVQPESDRDAPDDADRRVAGQSGRQRPVPLRRAAAAGDGTTRLHAATAGNRLHPMDSVHRATRDRLHRHPRSRPQPLGQHRADTRQFAIESLANLAVQNLDDTGKIESDISKHLALVGIDIRHVNINAFIKVLDGLFDNENNWEFDPDANPLQLQVYESKYVASTVNLHTKYFRFGKLMPNLRTEDMEQNTATLLNAVEEKTYSAKYLSFYQLHYIANKFFPAIPLTEERLSDMGELVAGLRFDSFKNSSRVGLMQAVSTQPGIVDLLPPAQRRVIHGIMPVTSSPSTELLPALLRLLPDMEEDTWQNLVTYSEDLEALLSDPVFAAEAYDGMKRSRPSSPLDSRPCW